MMRRKKPLNIVIINWFQLDHVGGIEVYLKSLLKQYINKPDINILFLYGVNSENIDLTETRSNIIIKPLSSINRIADLTVETLIQEINDIKDYIRKADILHFHNPHVFNSRNSLAILDEITKHNPSIKIVLGIHNLNKVVAEDYLIFKKFGTHVLTCSDFLKKGISTVYDVNESSIDVLPYYFPLPEKRKKYKQNNSNKIKILQPTRFCNWKGSNYSLKACISLIENNNFNVHFTHAGLEPKALREKWDKRWDKKLLFDTEKHIKLGNISFVKYSPKDTYNVFALYDLILHPTIGEGFQGDPNPIAAQQAVILNLPIIATNSGNLKNILENSTRSRVIEIKHIDSLARVIMSEYKQGLFNKKQIVINKNQYSIIKNSPQKHLEYYRRICNLRI